MVDAEFLDWIDSTVREIRDNQNAVFGGIQLVVCGDFSQLPPVPGKVTLQTKALRLDSNGFLLDVADNNKKIPTNVKECSAGCFRTAFWRDANFVSILLSKVWRQTDLNFIEALGHLRVGDGYHASVSALVNRCSRNLTLTPTVSGEPTIEPTVLYCTKMHVETENVKKLARLPGPEHSYLAKDWVVPATRAPFAATQKLENNSFFTSETYNQKVALKVGAQVMLIVNELGHEKNCKKYIYIYLHHFFVLLYTEPLIF
mmetsp:Transcript_30356/g.39136  ORF Transcript_30356/g.39136 Transcript_30356/m.39136 type:complete len:258 (+) Transcript_30356:106-879(+)